LPLGPILELVERELPARFGGGPLSYQLIQRDDRVVHGLASLALLVDPAVGEIDEPALVTTVERALTASGPYTSQFRRRDGWITVVRRKPFLTPAGKLLQLCHQSAIADGLASGLPGVPEHLGA
jgi:hypothetical protein